MKLNKIIFAATSVVALSAVTEAQAGFYAGVKGGWSHLSSKPDLKDDAGETIATKVKFKGNGFAGDIFAGYNMPMGPVTVGGEAAVGFDTTSKKKNYTDTNTPAGTTTTTVQGKLKRTFDTSVAALVGYQVMEGLTPFVRFGLGGTQFKAELKNTTTNLRIGKKSKFAFTYTPGVGADYKINDKFGARAEVNVAITPKTKLTINNTRSDLKNTYATSVKVGGVYNV